MKAINKDCLGRRIARGTLCMLLCLVIGGGIFAAISTIEANAESTSETLIDLSVKHTDANGSGFSGGNTIFIRWAAGSQSGSTWGAGNLMCGESRLTDLIVLETNDGESKTITEWGLDVGVKRIICYGDMMGVNL